MPALILHTDAGPKAVELADLPDADLEHLAGCGAEGAVEELLRRHPDYDLDYDGEQ